VLIPCFNEEENAAETITHALALDYPDVEVIAINDGSRDGTRRGAGEARRAPPAACG